jgi:hypothetical protein
MSWPSLSTGKTRRPDAYQHRGLAVCRSVADAAFGLDTPRPEYVEAGLHALQRAGLDNGSFHISWNGDESNDFSSCREQLVDGLRLKQ